MARQKAGQHFLSSTRVSGRIAREACPSGTALAVEIGPGKGALTEKLLDRVNRVVAMEIDPALAAGLRERWPDPERLYLLEGDALKLDWTQWGAGVLVGNLPYYVATALVSKYLANPGDLTQAVFMVQKEVAERITAKPGTRAFGYLSVECQYQAKTEYLFSVPPGAFRPPPQVDSAVIRLTPHPGIRPETARFLDFASACFRQKRKTLRNNLTARYPGLDVEKLPLLSLRAEQLSADELFALFRAIDPL